MQSQYSTHLINSAPIQPTCDPTFLHCTQAAATQEALAGPAAINPFFGARLLPAEAIAGVAAATQQAVVIARPPASGHYGILPAPIPQPSSPPPLLPASAAAALQSGLTAQQAAAPAEG